jgi:hypothetical protein
VGELSPLLLSPFSYLQITGSSFIPCFFSTISDGGGKDEWGGGEGIYIESTIESGIACSMMMILKWGTFINNNATIGKRYLHLMLECIKLSE